MADSFLKTEALFIQALTDSKGIKTKKGETVYEKMLQCCCFVYVFFVR